MDRLGQLPALHVTPADVQERSQVGILAEAVQVAVGQSVELAFDDQGHAGARPVAAADAHGIHLEVIRLPNAKRGFVLLPRRWVVERGVAWTGRFRRLARDCERLHTTLERFHFPAFALPGLKAALPVLALM